MEFSISRSSRNFIGTTRSCGNKWYSKRFHDPIDYWNHVWKFYIGHSGSSFLHFYRRAITTLYILVFWKFRRYLLARNTYIKPMFRFWNYFKHTKLQSTKCPTPRTAICPEYGIEY